MKHLDQCVIKTAVMRFLHLFLLSCNINFEKMEEGYKEYHIELLSETFKKLSAGQPEAYIGAWEMLRKGIDEGLMVPQFHGREHLNLKVFEVKLAAEDPQVMFSLQN